VTFLDKLRAAQETNRSWICIGLDPDLLEMPSAAGSGEDGVVRFCTAIVEATADLVCAYKPNLAFFLARGSSGIASLSAVVNNIPSSVPVILDAKFGDMGHTGEHYAAFAFEYLGADAVTVSPYVGTEAIRPFMNYTDRLAFVLTRSSNTLGNEFQVWPSADSPVYREVAEQVRILAEEYPGQLGLVAGATQPDELRLLRQHVPDLPFLVPGIGKQGGDLDVAVCAGMTSDGIGPAINAGRSVLYASQGSDYASAARERVRALLGEIEAIKQRNGS